jgi:hypothetical protein
MELSHEPVDLLVGPGVEKRRFRESGIGLFEGGGLFGGSLRDMFATRRRQAGESLPEQPVIQNGNREWAHATPKTAGPAGKLAQQRRRRPLEPTLGALIERRETGWRGGRHAPNLNLNRRGW